MASVDEARWFLNALFGLFVGTEAVIALWTMPDKTTQFFDNVDDAADYAITRSAECDVYFGTALYRPGITHGRGKLDDVVSITSVWVDIDIGSDGNKARPPTLDSAQSILTHSGVTPSIVVNSGHGLHAYWLLTEPLCPIHGAASLTKGWCDTIRAIARHQGGFELDSVGDLTRVMRVPGTYNRKSDPVIAVQVLSARDKGGLRYEPSDLRDWFVDQSLTKDGSSVVSVEPLILTSDRFPDRKKMEVMLENDGRFRRTWERKRTDMKDSSPSAYDLALVNFAIRNGQSDQFASDLVIAWRVKHGEALDKATRRKRMQDTIAKAKRSHRSATALQDLPDEYPAELGVITESERASILDALSNALEVRISGWIKHGTENAVYSLVLEDGRDVYIGPASVAISQTQFLCRIFDATGVKPKSVKTRLWDRVVNGLGRIAVVVENKESERVAQIAEWVESYLAIKPATACEDAEHLVETIRYNHPFERNGCLHIHAGALAGFIRMKLGEKVERSHLWPLLRVAGWEQLRVLSRATDGKVITRSYWRLNQDTTTESHEESCSNA